MSDLESNKTHQWPADGLEYLEHCPLCGNNRRKLLYGDLKDQIYANPGVWNYYRCCGCRSAYLDPRPNRNSIGLAYLNYPTHTYRELQPRHDTALSRLKLSFRNDYLNWRFGYQKAPSHSFGRFLMCFLPPFLRHEWDRFARHLPRPKPEMNRLLDVGCGNGDFLVQAREAGWEGQGLDIDPKAVEVARIRGLNVDLGGLEKHRFAEGTFDAVTLSHVIEHVHDPVQFLSECLRILKPGGTLWIATPNLLSLGHYVYRKEWCFLIHPPNHLVLFTSYALKQALQRVGATNIRSLRRGFHLTGVWTNVLAKRQNISSYDFELPSCFRLIA